MRRSAAALVLALLLPLPGLAGEVVVKPGETLSEIAERYGVSVQRLMQLNGLKDAKDLWAGSRIQVPGTASTARPTAAKPVVNRNAKEHKVMPGETLSEIADLYGVPMERLASLNGLAKPNALMAGTTLKLRTASAPKPAVKPATSKPVAAKPVAAKPAVKPAAQPTVQPVVQPVAAKPVVQPTPQPQPKPVAVAPKPAPATPVAAKPSTPDWRSYGPLQVDWANWQPMGGSFVAPSLNSDGQPLYLAIN